MFRSYLFMLLVFLLVATPAPARDLSPGAQRTLAAARSLSDYGDPFQERFDRLCTPIYKHAATLHGVERETYLMEADKKVSKKLKPGEAISCLSQKADLIEEGGRIAYIAKGEVHTVSLPFSHNGGRIAVHLNSKRVELKFKGRKIEFTYEPNDLIQNRIFNVNVPELSAAAFAHHTKGRGGNGLLPTSQLKIILDRVYWYAGEQETVTNLFDFYRELLVNPKTSSLQIMALYDKALVFMGELSAPVKSNH